MLEFLSRSLKMAILQQLNCLLAFNLLTVEAPMPHFDPVTSQFSATFGP